MTKYYTRACNFFYGYNSKALVKKKLALPLSGDHSISFNQIELFSRKKRKIKSKIVDLKNIKKLQKRARDKINKDIKKIKIKKIFIQKISHNHGYT